MSKDNITPAFPTTEEHGFNSGMHGMTLRDYFAAKSLHGLMSRNWSSHTGTDNELIEVWTKSAYVIADMMMESRKS